MENLITVLSSGVVLGSIYALVAIGMTLIYGILRVLDMSQGAMVMIGGYFGWLVMTTWGMSPVIALIIAFVATLLFGIFTQLISVQPLVGREDTDFEMLTFITTFAVAMVFTNLALQYIGPDQHEVPSLVPGSLHLYKAASVPWQSVVMTGIAILLMLAVVLYLNRSRYGIAIRAVAEDLDAARLMGIPIKRVFPVVMGVASALAGIAGVFLSTQFFASPTLGDKPLLVALIVVVLGGLGSLQGAVLAAYLIGMVEAASSLYIGSTWSLPIMYGVILLVLIIRPFGLMGRDTGVRL